MPNPFPAFFDKRRLGIFAGALLLIAGAVWLLRDRGLDPDTAPAVTTT